MKLCNHISEFGRVCEREQHDLQEKHRQGTVIWPTRPWGWSNDRLIFATDVETE